MRRKLAAAGVGLVVLVAASAVLGAWAASQLVDEMAGGQGSAG